VIEAEVEALEPERFARILDAGARKGFAAALDRGRTSLEGRTLWHVNSTLTGGGVAELLKSVLGYLTGAGILARWLAVEGTDEFFVTTKRIHHMLHGKQGDGRGLHDPDRSSYEQALDRELRALTEMVVPGDVVVLHDPQAVGLAPALQGTGAHVVWNCHVGADEPNDLAREAWTFLLPYVASCDAVVFSCKRYVWDGLGDVRVAIIPPCIDAFSPKNEEMDAERVAAVLSASGIVPSRPGEPRFLRGDGTAATVVSRAELVQDAAIPRSAPVVSQVSRWDPLKDHAGLAQAFAEGVPLSTGAHLVLAGPAPAAVSDDPEGAATLEELRECWGSLPEPAKSRVHIACLPMDDVEENAAIVNALQRRSTVVVQKSLAEGFGLTVAEAMWKERPTVASAVGGIQEQIVDGVNGVLIDDAYDLSSFADAITALLADPDRAARLGRNARSSVMESFLAPGYLQRYLALIAELPGV
jgi:trehalose synthase